MPFAHVNGVDLAYEDYGSGYPLVWVHEFAGSMESWDPQVHYFSRRYRVIVYNARGYPPSGVPEDASAYSQNYAVEDLHRLLRHLGIGQAHIAGLSMGGATTLQFGIRHPEMARSLIVAAAGSGSTNPDEFRASSRAFADDLLRNGAVAFEGYGAGATRMQLKRKDPHGYDEFMRLLQSHSPLGSAMTMRGVQAGRPPIFDSVHGMQALRIPTLIMVGDEDEPCLEPAMFMKKHIPTSGLAMFPQSGHPINLEEPALFNAVVADFLDAVEAGRWDSRVAQVK